MPIDNPSSSEKGAVRCCSKDGRTCVTPGAFVEPKSCLVTTFAEAEAKCAEEGMRICTADELDRHKCCNTGCDFNDKLTWRTGTSPTNFSKYLGRLLEVLAVVRYQVLTVEIERYYETLNICAV